jgi:hypothetical protein
LQGEDAAYQLPHRGKFIAPQSFHFHRNTIATMVFYLDLHAAMSELLPGVLRYGHYAEVYDQSFLEQISD